MLRFLFHRFSPTVLALEGVGALLIGAAAARALIQGCGLPQGILLGAVIALYLFLRLCATKRWYRGCPRWSGIELQFKKALVPASYILAISGSWYWLSPSAWPLLIAAAMLAVVAHVNIILLFLHRRDRGTTPPGFYATGAFLGAEK